MPPTDADGLMLRHGRIMLRDPASEDVQSFVRWETVETQWMEWDAPWEIPETPPDSEDVSQRILDWVNREKAAFHHRLVLCLEDGTRIGSTNCYGMPGTPPRPAVGIDIRESRYWGRGLGSEALPLWLAYVFAALDRDVLYCQTWSGNTRMIRLARSCGFREIERRVGQREVDGKPVDGIDYALGRGAFETRHPEVLRAVTTALAEGTAMESSDEAGA